MEHKAMNNIISGGGRMFGDNIDTDQIYPGKYLELVDHGEIAKHMLKGADPDFSKRYERGDIVVAGTNFGCGSSREHAAITLKEGGVGAVIAKSYARIFYRNGVNLGLPLIVCPAIEEIAKEGARLTIDLVAGTVKNEDTGTCASFEPFSGFAMEAYTSGGVIALMRKKREEGI
ncbi:3-isopropylmalate dehydratase small subunit [Christensenellaceae bacterium OttesenSCG-928-M15]|nr:3-isopropylmalate dehydratase small subunit [Christensenellaceae bacterium OttesenSCG-928-M15]